ncbi:UDP-N-acetylmuramoyl-L-alanine--D-glutamate ligase [Altererythrobacter aquiaggeris]|uniref:UDP-N-acetylmuramoyl-L-alanine--D-glutamate ligase n=1 Tax=Aestuarierythrobacter aquiaggeris TaxID=1898396 RepID=UPI0030160600
MIISTAFAGKKYAVLGLARSGLTAVATLLASGAEVAAWDREPQARGSLDNRVEVLDPLTADLTGYDGIVVSPGVPLNSHPITGVAAKFGVPIIGDIELFSQARATLPPHRVVGITGTNGKSTTTALVHHLLTEAGITSRMAGNIGAPILGEQPLSKGGVYVLELSSYQIDLTQSLACEVALLLNITPDHLDRYDSFEDYAFSKGRLFAMQASGQVALFGCDDAPTNAIKSAASLRRPQDRIVCIDTRSISDAQGEWLSLQGPHNLQNAAAAIGIVEALGVTRAQWSPGMASFRGLPHRMERVAEAGGVLFVNDSKATNPASTAPALAAFRPNPDPRIHWIVGGLPKSEDLSECEEYIGNVAAAYTIGEAGAMFANLLCERTHVERCEMMGEAVSRAIAAAKPGDVILLSPACASFDQFRDYEKRGDHFREVVGELTGMVTQPPAGDLKGKTAA